MASSRLTRLLELRRLLPLVAAVLFVLALRVPVWRITLTAPQYVDTLVVDLYAHPKIGGDWEEVRRLNKYVGFYYPDPVYVDPNYEPHEKAIDVPEWILGPVVFIGIAAASAIVAALPTDKISRGLTALFAGSIAIFGTMGALIQYRLYQSGHTLDPDAPLNGLEGFTPPLAGSYEVANISGTAWFGPGGYMMAVGVALLAVAFGLRHSPATITDVPGLVRTGCGRLRDRVARVLPRASSRGTATDPVPEGGNRGSSPPGESGDGSATNDPPRTIPDGDPP
ncbi:hypothetical protein [Natrinema altunense]|uniref:Uncharacterized protein n=1 Tax=Natrinema altunense TaxID=222984 RepID=A0A482XZS5_9EURY|nr:hypothetical protein [Natrinema altunense]RZH69231.1 hypothetical protein ELS17_07255 [Natrinema altunense]